MTVSIRELIGDEGLVALTYRQVLEPVAGREAPVHPPTYPVARGKRSGEDDCRAEYTINEIGNGVRICELDTAQSQANRMEASYRGELAGVIPRHVVEAGGHRADLTELSHRIADAAIRATGLAGKINGCFEAYAAGDAVPMARLAPTSLVYGTWDSRGTRVSVRRALESRIEANDIVECARSAQYTAVFGQAELGLTNTEWRKGSKAGFAPAPATGRPGGLRVRGEIVQSATVVLNVFRGYRMEDGSGLLACYLLGLALGGLLTGGRRYQLRSGCDLVPAAPARWQAVHADGERRVVEIGRQAVIEELRALAREWSAAAGVKLGGEPEVHRFDPRKAKKMLAAVKVSRAD